MIKTSATFSLLAAASIAASVANAREAADPASVRTEQSQIQLVQVGEVDVFIDERGRRVLLDRATGELVAVETPRGFERVARDPGFSPEVRGPDYDLERRIEREIELGRREPPDPYRDDYGVARDRGFDEPDWRDPEIDRGYEEREPVLAEREPIERRPLDNPMTGSVLSPSIVAPGTGPSAALEPALPEADQGVPASPDLVVPQVGQNGSTEAVTKIQVLLDRAGVSPGVIDGRMGDNVNKAISAYRELTGQALRTYDAAFVDAELERTGGPAIVDYTITPEDAATALVASIPEDYGRKAELEHMSYTSVSEMLAERFHMDEAYLKRINANADFSRPGEVIRVINPGQPMESKVARIVANKQMKQVQAFDASGKLVAAYPATIGSSATPSPTGTHTVERIAFDPEYTYNPKINFKQGDNDKVLRIPPGPNGPVGSIWIALSKPTYGIHGTPEPSKIGKTESNGCIRLTNWDARELAKQVEKGVIVQFVE